MLLALVLVCVTLMAPLTKVGALLLLPYIGWLIYITLLSYAVLCLNGPSLNYRSDFNELSIFEQL